MKESSVMQARQAIENGSTYLGIELGSTRIKAVLIDQAYRPVATGGCQWENQLEDGIWTYRMEDVWSGIQASFQELAGQVRDRYGLSLPKVGAIGISAMMHGYLVFDQSGKQLVPFRTWRNTMTSEAAAHLTGLFGFQIPQRWSIAHLYQAILDKEAHVPGIASMTTLAGYVHTMLTGEKVAGVGDASGMFPIDSASGDYNQEMLKRFAPLSSGIAGWELKDILPRVLQAGELAGTLTPQGAALLDPSGRLQPGIPFCPPEGDAGTGMVATNSVAARTGNVSAGTSVFAMVVLERELSKIHAEIDMVTTPAGKPVAMVHCNNCTSDIDAWIGLLQQAGQVLGGAQVSSTLYESLYRQALEGDPDCGGILSYNYLSGEHITGLEQGRPLLVRQPGSRFTLPNLMRSLMFSALATLRIGMDILTGQEQVRLDRMFGHGGFFKTPGTGQKIMAAALEAPISVMESAGEGGAWGIALLAAYLARKQEGQSLEAFLSASVFAGDPGITMEPDLEDMADFTAYMERYRGGLPIERAAVEYF